MIDPRLTLRLEALLASTDRTASLAHDPLGLVRRYVRPLDRELAGLIASAAAYGRVDLFRPRLAMLFDAWGPSPAQRFRAAPEDIAAASSGFHYRMTGPAEISALTAAGVDAQRRFGSLGALARLSFDAAGGDPRGLLTAFVAGLWNGRPLSRRLKHLVASPDRGSACKRLNLYFRWMIRPDDGVDLGIWDLPATALVMPIDTHVHRISRLVGLTRRTDLSWKTAESVTAALKRLDDADPVRFDFAISHLGISSRCRSRPVPSICLPCPLRPVCRVGKKVK